MNNGTDNQRVLGNCPTCQRLMQIPLVTDVSSVAKCPHCQHKIPVRDLLSSVVPEAEIVDESGDDTPGFMVDRQREYDNDGFKSREKFEVPKQLYEGASRRSRKRRSKKLKERLANGDSSKQEPSATERLARSERGGRSANRTEHTQRKSQNGTVGQVSSSTGVKVKDRRSPPTASALQSVPQPRRRSSDVEDDSEYGVMEVLKLLFGGLIAAPLAYLILLWLLGVDPLGMASTFESVSPAIIPPSLRSETGTDDANDPPSSDYTPRLKDPSTNLFDDPAGDEEGLPLPSLDPDLVR